MDNQNKKICCKEERVWKKNIVEGHSTATNLIFVHDTFGHCDDRRCRFIYHFDGISYFIEFVAHISVVLMNYAVHLFNLCLYGSCFNLKLKIKFFYSCGFKKVTIFLCQPFLFFFFFHHFFNFYDRGKKNR